LLAVPANPKLVAAPLVRYAIRQHDEALWEPYKRSPEGIYEASGGEMPPGGFHGQGAGTSRIAVAWWTSPSWVRHVRIKGGRIKTRQKSLFWACKKHPFFCIYPSALFVDSDGITKMRCSYCGRVGKVEDLTPNDDGCCAICESLNEYVAMTGFLPAVGRKNCFLKIHQNRMKSTKYFGEKYR
jgi:hypothetical protein